MVKSKYFLFYGMNGNELGDENLGLAHVYLLIN